MQSITIQPIGIVHSPVADAVDEDWGKVISAIHVDESLADGLHGLADWSHIIVIFLMHETEFIAEEHLTRRPRNLDDMPQIGIFAQRARHRPNQIGITAVKVVEVKDNIVRVRGLDAIHGTPVLDIKPYAPIYDGVHNPLVPGWFIRLMQGYF